MAWECVVVSARSKLYVHWDVQSGAQVLAALVCITICIRLPSDFPVIEK